MMQLFLLFILAHLLADFVTQTDALIKRKNVYWRKIKLSKGLTEHVLHHMIISLLLVWSVYGVDVSILLIIVCIGVLHYVIDFFNVAYSDQFIRKNKDKNALERTFLHHVLTKRTFYFLLDQLFHMLTIFFVLFTFKKIDFVNFLIRSVANVFVHQGTLDLTAKILLVCILVILLIFASGSFINKILLDIKREERHEIAAALEQDYGDPVLSNEIKHIEKNLTVEQSWERTDGSSKRSIKIYYHDFLEPELDQAGKYIGYLERLLIGIFILIDAYQGLALLGTLKTIARFKQFESKAFAEYYLIGTLLSFVAGIGFSLVIKFVLQL